MPVNYYDYCLLHSDKWLEKAIDWAAIHIHRIEKEQELKQDTIDSFINIYFLFTPFIDLYYFLPSL